MGEKKEIFWAGRLLYVHLGCWHSKRSPELPGPFTFFFWARHPSFEVVWFLMTSSLWLGCRRACRVSANDLRWAERLSAGAQEAQHTKVAKVEEKRNGLICWLLLSSDPWNLVPKKRRDRKRSFTKKKKNPPEHKTCGLFWFDFCEIFDSFVFLSFLVGGKESRECRRDVVMRHLRGAGALSLYTAVKLVGEEEDPLLR